MFATYSRLLALTVMLAVSLPLRAQQAPVARVLKSRGAVTMKRLADADFTRPVTAAVELFSGDALRSGADGFASLVFIDDKTLIKLKANTQFTIVESQNARTINLDYGTIRSSIPQPIKTFAVETPVSVASVKATEFWLISDLASGIDRAYGLEGVVEILNIVSGAIQNLAVNTLIISTAAGVLTPPTPIDPSEMPTDPDEVDGLEPEPEPEPGDGEEGDAGDAGEEVPVEEVELVEATVTPVEEPAEPPVEPVEEEAPPSGGGGPGFGLGLGSVTLDGIVYYQIALRPEFSIGKVGVGLDLVGYMDGQGNFRKDEWDEPSDYLDKIYYLRYGTDRDRFFFQIGGMPQIQYGFGGLMNNYSNLTEYPQVRRVGFEIGGRITDKVTLRGFSANLKEFGYRGGLVGLRGTYQPSRVFPLTFGVNLVADLNQYGGLKDKDGDLRPDIVDDFPDDAAYWLDSDGDGWADNNDSLEFDIDGDGFTDNSPDPTNQPNNDIDGIDRKSEPFNLAVNQRSIVGLSADVSFPLLSRKSLNLMAYTEVSFLKYQDTLDAERGDSLVSRDVGFGVVGPGIRARMFNFLTVSLEYRYSSSLYQPGFFNTTYDYERARFERDIDTDSTIVETKEQATFTNAYPLSGYYGSASMNLFNLVTFEAAYQAMAPAVAGSDTLQSNSFIANLAFNTDPIPKISEARAYYFRTNDANPLDFANPSSNTTWGYRIGYQLAPSVTLLYNLQESYRDLDGNGRIEGDDERIRILSIETAFSF